MDEALLFGRHTVPIGDRPPDWHSNPMTRRQAAGRDRDWWTIPDFDPALGDIKAVWELARLDWALAFAERARNGDAASLARLNAWLSGWSVGNPPYKGVNWKCAQEASIRVLHLLAAALVLGQERVASEPLAALIELHLRRIAPTTGYAAGQQNNHATSEAAALFCGGLWLEANSRPGAGFERLGRRELERHVARLVAPDGSFSQYSMTYHRVLLDTLSFAEVVRRRLGSAAFSDQLYQRARAATHWLHAFVDPLSGEAPNIGANDGARLLPLTDTDYRDFRPSVQLAAALFLAARAYEEPTHDHALVWLKMQPATGPLRSPASIQYDSGGFAVLRNKHAAAVLRYPRFRFRPSQSDMLHLDLSVDGRNLLRDGGTYGYAAAPEVLGYFGGIRSHNSIQFDEVEPMPRLGRFLLGDWPKTDHVEPLDEIDGEVRFAAGYRDRAGRSHRRALRLAPDRLLVADRIGGFRSKAVLRWRLAPGDWRMTPGGASSDEFQITVTSDVALKRVEILRGEESRYYLERTELPVLEVEVDRPASLVSEIRWRP